MSSCTNHCAVQDSCNTNLVTGTCGSTRKNVYGTPYSDAVTYSVPTVSTGDLICASEWVTLRSVCLQEMSRRSTSGSITTAVTGNLVYTTNYNDMANKTRVWVSSPTLVTTSDLITAAQFNNLGSAIKSSGKICLCNCNYCTCNCNYCTCNCDHCVCDCAYDCTCNCDYHFIFSNCNLNLKL